MSKTVTVQAGDTLSQIAQREGVTMGAITGYRSGDPDLIFPGETLTIGQQAPERTPTQVVDSPPGHLQPGIVDPDATEAFQATQRVMDATPDRMLAQREAETQRRIDQDRKRQELLQDERRTLAQKQADIMQGSDMEGLVRREREELGVPEFLDAQRASIEEMRGLRQQMTDLEQQKGEALATSEGRQAPLGFIRGEQARIAEQFDRREAVLATRLQTENAHMQAMQGQVNQARALISDIVKAATFDTEMELNRIQVFREVNQAELSELDQSIQRDLQESQRYWENQLQIEREEKQQVLDLMINAPGAGISVNDTLEEAHEKASAFAATQIGTEGAATAGMAEAITFEEWRQTEEAQRAFRQKLTEWGMTEEDFTGIRLTEHAGDRAQRLQEMENHLREQYQETHPATGTDRVGRQIDIWNRASEEGQTIVEAARKMVDEGYSEGELRAFLSQETNLRVGETNQIVEEAIGGRTSYDLDKIAESFIAQRFETYWLRARGGELRIAKNKTLEAIEQIQVGTQMAINDEIITVTESFIQELRQAVENIPDTRDEAKRIKELSDRLEE